MFFPREAHLKRVVFCYDLQSEGAHASIYRGLPYVQALKGVEYWEVQLD